jgi:predicted NBD/HSP70 family sugar kinase
MAKPAGRYAIGIDVGGTKCACGIVCMPDGRALARRLQPTRPQRGGEPLLIDVMEIARSLHDEARQLGVNIDSIGLGVAELVSPVGEVLSDATIRWKNVGVRERIERETGLKVFVDADVRAAARGEAHLGAGRKFTSFLYVTVGTGISASIVIQKLPYAGTWGLTGTFASSPGLIAGDDGAVVSGPPLEQFAAGPALAARYAAQRPDFSGAGPEVLKLAESGDSAARSIVISAGQALGAGVAQLVNTLDPEAVVIGGGLGLARGLYRTTIEESMRGHVWSELHRDVPLLTAKLGKDAGWIGAALGALLNLHDSR